MSNSLKLILVVHLILQSLFFIFSTDIAKCLIFLFGVIAPLGQGLLNHEVPRPHTTTHNSQ